MSSKSTFDARVRFGSNNKWLLVFLRFFLLLVSVSVWLWPFCILKTCWSQYFQCFLLIWRFLNTYCIYWEHIRFTTAQNIEREKLRNIYYVFDCFVLEKKPVSPKSFQPKYSRFSTQTPLNPRFCQLAKPYHHKLQTWLLGPRNKIDEKTIFRINDRKPYNVPVSTHQLSPLNGTKERALLYWTPQSMLHINQSSGLLVQPQMIHAWTEVR